MTSTTNSESLPTPQTIKIIQSKAKTLLSNLQNETTNTNRIQSWVRKDHYNTTSQTKYPTVQSKYFDTNGFLHVSSFLTKDEIHSLKNDMKSLVENEWFPNAKKTSVFRTDEKQIETQGKDDYFLSSSNKVHYFAEKDAIEESSSDLKDEYRNNKIMALNKAGHALHLLQNTSFHTLTQTPKFHSLLLNDIGYQNPTIPQSMYIFKQPFIGSEVTSHQDSTFLHTSPHQTCVGFWFALDDADLCNGCLWVRPRSHTEGLRRKFVRNVDYFNGDNDAPMLIFQNCNGKEVAWEGKIPNASTLIPTSLEYYTFLLELGFVPIECKAGDVLVFNGQVDHFSLPNYSSEQRHTFQLHLIEGVDCGVSWDDDNWLQYSDVTSFMTVY